MSSSSRSIAAARQKRAGEQVQNLNTNRPVTSITSHNVFAQQYQQMAPPPISNGNKNIRGLQKNQSFKNNNMVQTPQENNSKITFSDAVGLITLRLGRLENIVNETMEEISMKSNNTENNNNVSIPPNMKIISDEVFENIVNRINLLESKIITFGAQIENINKEFIDIKNLSIHNNITLEKFIHETNDKFVVYENALSELENNLQPVSEEMENVEVENNNIIMDNKVDENTENTENTEPTEIIQQE